MNTKRVCCAGSSPTNVAIHIAVVSPDAITLPNQVLRLADVAEAQGEPKGHPAELAEYAGALAVAGEELFFDYGEAWEKKWMRFKEEQKGRQFDEVVPRFWSLIGVPLGFYPEHWLGHSK